MIIWVSKVCKNVTKCVPSANLEEGRRESWKYRFKLQAGSQRPGLFWLCYKAQRTPGYVIDKHSWHGGGPEATGRLLSSYLTWLCQDGCFSIRTMGSQSLGLKLERSKDILQSLGFYCFLLEGIPCVLCRTEPPDRSRAQSSIARVVCGS